MFKEKILGLRISGASAIKLDFISRTKKWSDKQLPRIMKNINEYKLINRCIEVKNSKNVFEEVVKRIESL